jgi:mannose-6-phosphate isomerase class I
MFECACKAHPDKMLAKILHERDPEHYPDANHKPEMAIALTKFEALNGFRSINQIKKHVVEYPELRTVIGPGGLCSISNLILLYFYPTRLIVPHEL